MARRAAPPGSGPAYVSKNAGSRKQIETDESSFSRFLREEIYAPEKLPGNLSILTGVGLFAGGIVVVRTWGEIFVPF